jgi:hypothetical protein
MYEENINFTYSSTYANEHVSVCVCVSDKEEEEEAVQLIYNLFYFLFLLLLMHLKNSSPALDFPASFFSHKFVGSSILFNFTQHKQVRESIRYFKQRFFVFICCFFDYFTTLLPEQLSFFNFYLST